MAVPDSTIVNLLRVILVSAAWSDLEVLILDIAYKCSYSLDACILEGILVHPWNGNHHMLAM